MPRSELFPIVYLPVENRTRELGSKLLVACALVDRGVHVVIGQQWLINENIPNSPPGIYVFKGLNAVQVNNMRFARRHGHRPVANDEEALGVADKWFMTKDVVAEAGRTADRIFALGEVHQSVLMEHCGMPAEKVPVVGNPRLDLLRPRFLSMHDDEVAAIRQQYGRFVLFNTNSAGVNSRWGSLSDYRKVLEQIGWIDPDSEADQQLFEEHIAHDHRNIQAVVKTVQRLSRAMPDLPVVIRPHPAERSDRWEAHFRKLKTVTVIPESDHVPWIQASSLLVATGCTTGMEAQYMGKPCLALCPGETRWHKFYLSNLVNVMARTPKDASGCIISHMNGAHDVFAEHRHALTGKLDRYVARHDDRYGFEIMADSIVAMLSEEIRHRTVPDITANEGVRASMKLSGYRRHKITVDEDEVRAMMQTLRRCLQKPTNIALRTLGESLFQLSPQ